MILYDYAAGTCDLVPARCVAGESDLSTRSPPVQGRSPTPAERFMIRGETDFFATPRRFLSQRRLAVCSLICARTIRIGLRDLSGFVPMGGYPRAPDGRQAGLHTSFPHPASLPLRPDGIAPPNQEGQHEPKGRADEPAFIGLAWPGQVAVRIPVSHRQGGESCACKRLSIHSLSYASPDPRTPCSLPMYLLPLRVRSVQPGSDSPGQNS